MGAALACMAIVVASTEGVAYSQTPPSQEQVEEGIRFVWPDNLEDWAVAVADCESDLGSNPNTYNELHSGPFQMSVATWRAYFERLGHSWVDIQYDPYWSAWAGYQIFLEQGEGAWPNCP